jgi:hypothetical protein
MGAYEFSEEFRGLASNLTKVSADITRETVLTATNDACGLVAYILPNGAAPVSGQVTAEVWIAENQPKDFVKRHYQIMPGNKASSATARVKLYFSQQEFTDYNDINEVKLPTNAADAENYKANLRIEKRSGISTDDSGLPGSYTGSISTFKPSDVLGSDFRRNRFQWVFCQNKRYCAAAQPDQLYGDQRKRKQLVAMEYGERG